MNRLAILCALGALCVSCGGSTPPPPEQPVAGSPPSVAAPAAPPEPGLAIKPVSPNAADPGLDRAHQATLDFYAGDLDKLHERFSPELARSLSLEQLVALRRRVADEFGKEVAVLEEDSKSKDQYRGYVRFAKFDKFKDPIEVQWILKPDDTIAGFFIRPARMPKKAQ